MNWETKADWETRICTTGGNLWLVSAQLPDQDIHQRLSPSTSIFKHSTPASTIHREHYNEGRRCPIICHGINFQTNHIPYWGTYQIGDQDSARCISKIVVMAISDWNLNTTSGIVARKRSWILCTRVRTNEENVYYNLGCLWVPNLSDASRCKCEFQSLDYHINFFDSFGSRRPFCFHSDARAEKCIPFTTSAIKTTTPGLIAIAGNFWQSNKVDH